MDSKDVSIRDINESDIPFILKYWFESPQEYIEDIGVDLVKMPTEEEMGIATKSYLLACGEFIRRFELKKIVFKTPLQNTAALKVKEKLGIRKLGQEEVSFGIIRDGTMAEVYEITAEELPLLLQQQDLR